MSALQPSTALLFWLAAACEPAPTGVSTNPADSGAAPDSAVDTNRDSVDSAGGADSGDSASATDTDTAADTGDTAPDDSAVGPVPTMADPFVIDGCGFQDDGPTLVPVPDMDGDGEEELLVVVDAEVEVYGSWLVSSTAATAPYWDQPLSWGVAGRVTTVPDLDGDGLVELYSVEGNTVTRLHPDGTITAWTGVPTAFAPWHDVDGDGVDELLVGAPALSADGLTTGYVAVMSAANADPSTWLTLTTIVGEGLGVAVDVGTLDQDGDGLPEVVVTDADDGYLLASASLDAGGALADATLAAFAGIAGREPVVIGDVDGGGQDDVAFPPTAEYGSYIRLFSGEAPEVPVDWGGPSDFGDIGGIVVGPDGAGGLALWAVYSPSVQAYDLGDLLGGENTLLTSGWSGRVASWGLAASSSSLWLRESTAGSLWATRVVAAKLDPAVADAVLAEVEGGGPGYGGLAEGAGLDDLDGDGALDWWQLSEAQLYHHPLEPGATVTICDATADAATDWSAADPGDDLDGDGVPEVAWWGEPESTGLWNVSVGSVATYAFDGTLGQLGCDLTGDGARELQFSTFGRTYLVDGAAWLALGIGRSVLAHIDDDGVCIGDLDGDGVSEVAAAFTDVLVYSGASLSAGAPAVVATVEGPYVGRVQALGDVDGDGLGDLSFYTWLERNGRCILSGADLLTTPTRALADVPCGTELTHLPADVDGDGVNELLFVEADTITAWWPLTGAAATVWTSADDDRDEPLLEVLPDAFGTGKAAIVLGPQPIVVYALE